MLYDWSELLKPVRKELNEEAYAYAACKYLDHVPKVECEELLLNWEELLLREKFLKNGTEEENDAESEHALFSCSL